MTLATRRLEKGSKNLATKDKPNPANQLAEKRAKKKSNLLRCGA